MNAAVRSSMATLFAIFGMAMPASPADAPARPWPQKHGQVDAKLTLGSGDSQPLIVGFGGAEGGNLFCHRSLDRSNAVTPFVPIPGIEGGEEGTDGIEHANLLAHGSFA